MKHTECKDCELSNGDCGYHFKMDGTINYDIASLSACDRYGNCEFFKPKAKPKSDLISREALKKYARVVFDKDLGRLRVVDVSDIDNALTIEEIEKPFITECRNAAIKENLPLYFVYYNETGIFEVYITETKELFEKRHFAKQLPTYKFKEIVNRYLDDYSDWKGRADMRGGAE